MNHAINTQDLLARAQAAPEQELRAAMADEKNGDLAMAALRLRALAECSASLPEFISRQLTLADILRRLSYYGELAAVLDTLHEAGEQLSPAQALKSRLLFAVIVAAKGKMLEARDCYLEVLQKAQKAKLSEYAGEALFGLASLAQDAGSEEASVIAAIGLNLLATIDPQPRHQGLEAIALQTEKKARPPIRLDFERKRIHIGAHWLALHEKPLLFRFFSALAGSYDFAPKADVAAAIWPSEVYRPMVHDPRIFDLARRLRRIVNTYGAGLQLFSGRHGYSLGLPVCGDAAASAEMH